MDCTVFTRRKDAFLVDDVDYHLPNQIVLNIHDENGGRVEVWTNLDGARCLVEQLYVRINAGKVKNPPEETLVNTVY